MTHDPQCHRAAVVKLTTIADRPYLLSRCPGCGAVAMDRLDRALPPGGERDPNPLDTSEEGP